MESPAPPEDTRQRIGLAVGLSILLPGLGHLVVRRRAWCLFWFLLCQLTLFAGLLLAGATQFDYGRWFGLGAVRGIFVVLPEVANFLGTQVAAQILHSVENGGADPTWIPYRDLGHLLSGASGVLACFAAAHAAGQVLAADLPRPGRRNPGTAALASLLLPGLGHWLVGRRFKAVLLGGTVLGLFLLGMALGGFADFDRQRHPYYWAGQMFGGGAFWLVALAAAGARFTEVLRFMDAGLLFTTSAGLFNVILALDAWRRAEDDWLAAGEEEV
ncbi:MAG: hypothetical protein D6702_05670 [Planctomycetota bacterium]|nr:MAG: hypothetical protein D6702_05670 [Planctomycetota bacterium]